MPRSLTDDQHNRAVMPTYNNSFKSPVYIEHAIQDPYGELVGLLRVKPSGLLWKAKGKHSFRSINIDLFSAWIETKESGAKTVSK